MGERPPEFITKSVTWAPDCYMVKVHVSTCGDCWFRFFGKTEREANRRAEAFIADTTAKHLKSLAAVQSRRAGRIRQSLKAAHDAPERAE
jgi:hypothetical protein